MFFDTLDAAWPPWRVISSSISSRLYFLQRAGDDQRLALQRPRAAGACGRFHLHADALQIGDRLRAELAVQEIEHALGDDRADFVGLAQLLDVAAISASIEPNCSAKHRGHARADVADRQGVQQPGQAAILARFDAFQQIVGRFAAHPLQIQQPILVVFQPVEIAVVANELVADQLIDQLVAQPFDVHRVAAGEIAEPLLHLGRAFDVRAADIDAAFVLDELRAALGALRSERRTAAIPAILRPQMLFDADDVRNDFAGLLDHDRIAGPNVLALDFVGIVQTGAADRRAGQFDRLQIGHGRNRAGLAHLNANGVQPRGGLVLLELVGDDPAGAFRRAAEPLALVETVDLQHQPVDLEIQLVQPLDQFLAMLDGRGERRETLDVRRGAPGRSRAVSSRNSICVLAFRPRVSPAPWQKNRSRRSATDPRIELADAAGRDVAGVGERRLALRAAAARSAAPGRSWSCRFRRGLPTAAGLGLPSLGRGAVGADVVSHAELSLALSRGRGD